ncbi:MAG: PIG-L family deacetylase, partial [Bacilli bacterium]|nr:PIG-L family deacetylase [Bacilli bacterium]
MNSFKNKDIMIIVPHQDDELNICGGMFTSDYFDMSRVKIVFSTNGDYLCNYKARVRETNRLVRRLKMKRENIIYLGYSDQYYNEDNHIYMVHEPNVFTSKKGDSVTFSNNYHFKKYGENNKFNYESFVSDIKEVILDNKPGVIFAIDFDSHPDHRA